MITSKYILIINLLGIIATIYYVISGVAIAWWLSSIIIYFIFSCLGITVTFHRFLTHGSFKFRWRWMEKLFILFGSLASTGSAIGWVAVHKQHHKYSDTDNDVHGPVTGWRNFIIDYDKAIKYSSVKFLIRDPYILFLHKHGLYVLLVYYLILFILGGIQAVSFLGLIPQVMTGLISLLCNWFAHFSGYRTYNTNDDSRNNWWLSIITWGDSWHNNHHAKPNLYSFRHEWWEIDISAIIITLIKSKGKDNVCKN